MTPEFEEQARLMLRIMPHVAAEDCFALKGGTAINFFVRDTPRLSVDIDLTYLPIQPRKPSLKGIGAALERIEGRVLKAIPGTRARRGTAEGVTTKLLVQGEGGLIKVEPNTVIRGTVFTTAERDVSPGVRDKFEMDVTMRVLGAEDLFGGKICAALDRQHPRDLFDIKHLLDGEGVTEGIRKAFIVYWISHPRPLHELIDPNRKDFRAEYESHFVGMTDETVKYEDLVDARERLIKQLQRDLTQDERQFVISIKEGAPKWKLLGLSGVDKLPAVQWKLRNIGKMGSEKHEEYLQNLKDRLQT